MAENLQINRAFEEAATTLNAAGVQVTVTPPLDEDYWLFRVPLTERQAVVGFPKFGTIGIGFQLERDWNCNLPYSCDPLEIYEHIEHNAGEDIPKDRVIEAIGLVRDAAEKLMQARNN